MEPVRLREIARNFPENGMRFLLENPKNVRDLLALAGSKELKYVDLERLALVKETFIKRDFNHLEADVLLHAPLASELSRERDLWIYILIEHQSTKDPRMPLRLFLYLAGIYDFLDRAWQRCHGRHARPCLEPVLPVVFFTGTER